MLKEAKGHVVGGRNRRSRRRDNGKSRGGSRRWKATSTRTVVSRLGRIEKVTIRQAKGSSRAGDWEVEGQGTTVH